MSDHIADHIITDILSRLPSISLLRFKTVCKLWYFLISDPYLINLHFKRASQNPKIFLTTRRLQFQLLDSESSFSAPLDFPIPTPKGNNYDFVKILGSSCGLICVAAGHIHDEPRTPLIYRYSFFLWNPSTKEFRKIPDLSDSVIESHRIMFGAHGLGYDPVSNDFKFVVVNLDRTTLNVFSMELNSWKSVAWPSNLNSNSRFYLDDTPATVLNGVFHWLIHSDLGLGSEIIAFDSKEDEFLNVQIPHIPSSSSFLLEHKGCLCISFSRRKPEYGEEIWMLKKHGWIHLLSISSKSLSESWFYRRALGLAWCFWPICISSNGTRVILHNKEHIVRSTEEDEKFDRLHKSTTFQAIMYVESMISPNHIQESEHRHKPKKQRRCS